MSFEVETVFFIKDKCLVIQKGDTQTKFDEEVTKNLTILLVKKIFGNDTLIITNKGKQNV